MVTRDTLLGTVPPFYVLFKTYEDIRHKLDNLRTGKLTLNKISILTDQVYPSKPLEMLSERKKDLIIKSQVNLLGSMKEYFRVLSDLNDKVLSDPTLEEYDIYQIYDSFHPSYARRHFAAPESYTKV